MLPSGETRFAKRSRFAGDEAGSFLVVEAILVALLVLGAILFFTSVQRPTFGNESRGLDLGPVATDTLDILQRRAFTTPAVRGDPEDWVTKVLAGNTTAAAAVDDFITQVLPVGAKHAVRLSNGVGTLDLLPLASPGRPQGARAAEVPLLPRWQAHASRAVQDLATPGQALAAAANPVLARFADPSSDIACIKAPYNATATSLWRRATSLAGTLAAGSPLATGLASTALLEVGMPVTGAGVPAAATVAAIPDATSVTLSAPATASGAATLSFHANRVPANIPYGVWAGYTDAGCTANPAYAAVVLPGARTVGDAVTTADSKAITSATAAFSATDVGRLVAGAGIPGGAYLASVASATQALLSANATATAAGVQLTFAPNPTYAVYGLQLVVWFGA